MNPELASAIPGPSWLIERRTAAAVRATASAMPQVDEEIWRYSRIDELNLDRYAYSPAASSMVEPSRVQAPTSSTARSWQCPPDTSSKRKG